MSEITAFAKEFAVIGGDCDICVRGTRSNSSSTTPSKYFTASICRCRSARSLPCQKLFPSVRAICRLRCVVQVLKHAMNAADTGPLFFRLAGQSIWIMRFAHIQQVKGRLLLREGHLRQHRAHIVVAFH